MEVCVLVGATVGIGSKVEPWAALTPWRRWPAVSSSRSWTKGKMGMVGRMEREKRNRERRKKGREKGGAAGRRRGRRSGRRRRRRQWVDGDGCAGKEKEKMHFQYVKSKIQKALPYYVSPCQPTFQKGGKVKKVWKNREPKSLKRPVSRRVPQL